MAIKRVYGTFRPERISSPFNANGITFNGVYTASFWLRNMFADYEAAGLTKIVDDYIPEDRYTAELVPGVPKLTRFIIGEYEDSVINGADFAKSIAAVGARFQIEIFPTLDECKQWVRDNTNLQEDEGMTGTFLIHEAGSDMGIDCPAKYLSIV